jgi:hypothetical protein
MRLGRMEDGTVLRIREGAVETPDRHDNRAVGPGYTNDVPVPSCQVTNSCLVLFPCQTEFSKERHGHGRSDYD